MLRGRADFLASSTEHAGDQAVEDDRVGAGLVDQLAEGAAGAPALAEDRRHPAEPARAGGPARPAGRDHVDAGRRPIDQPLARRVDAAERHLHAAPDQGIGELADEALDAARAAPGSRTAAARGSGAASWRRSSRDGAAQQLGEVDPPVVWRRAAPGRFAQGAQAARGRAGRRRAGRARPGARAAPLGPRPESAGPPAFCHSPCA
jgi:hypothetical protein